MFSHSRISAFEQCPLKFKFRYIDKVEVEVSQTVEQFLGKTVHSALEELYTLVQFEKIPTIEELLSIYNKTWEETWEEGILIVDEARGLTKDNYKKMGERYLREYYSRYSPFDKGKTLGLEAKVLVLLPGGEQMIGFIDRLVSSGNGNYEIHDYKTNKKLKSQEELDGDRQLALYALGIRQQFPDAKKIGLVWHFLALDREMRSERTKGELEALAKRTAGLIEKIKKEKNFPAKESALCPYCEYQEICPKRAHLFAGKKSGTTTKENKYFSETGSNLADSYAKLKSQTRLLDEELEKIREAILKFSEENKVDNLFGREFVAKVRRDEVIGFPKEGKERDEFVALLKEKGIWEKVEEFNQFALRRMIIEGEIDNSRIERFEKKEIRTTVTVSKRKD
ncbi:MAG: PD-(D/E)XK nuclease family protein [archaeon]